MEENREMIKLTPGNLRQIRREVFEEHEEERRKAEAEQTGALAKPVKKKKNKKSKKRGEACEKEAMEADKENVMELPVEEQSASAVKKKEGREEIEDDTKEMEEMQQIDDIRSIAETAKRNNTKAEAAVAMYNSFMTAINSPKRISEDVMQRAIDACAWKPREVLPPVEEKEEEEALISCILFGVRCDMTRIKPKEEDGENFYSSVRTERHITLTSEPGGAYVGHLVPASEDSQAIAAEIHSFLVEYGIDKSLVYFGGVGGGNGVGGIEGAGQVAHFLEKRLGHRLTRVVCELDTNDISLRRVVEELAGPYREENPGKLWELASGPPASTNALKFDFNADFEILTPPIPLRDIAPEVLAGLPADQEYAYRIAKMITTGVVDNGLLNCNIRDFLSTDISCLHLPNPNFHDMDFPDYPEEDSYWLRAASLFARLWISEHGLTGKDLATLRAIVQLIVGVYIFLRFEIQADSSLARGPYRKLKEIQILQSNEAKDPKQKKAKEAAFQAAERGAWHAHSEHILLALLSSDDEDDRQFAIAKIMDIRGRSKDGETNVGDSSLRSCFPPRLNREATSIRDLQDWTGATEPFATTPMSDEQVRQILTTPLLVPKIPAHSRCCLRCAKRVCLASHEVVGPNQRDAHIRASGKSRHISR